MPKQIDSNTQIIFTVKSFIALITTILGIFFGFYQLVITPKIETVEKHYIEVFNDQKEQNRLFYKELSEINSSIGSLNASIEAFNNSNTNYTAVTNSSGSFGEN